MGRGINYRSVDEAIENHSRNFESPKAKPYFDSMTFHLKQAGFTDNAIINTLQYAYETTEKSFDPISSLEILDVLIYQCLDKNPNIAKNELVHLIKKMSEARSISYISDKDKKDSMEETGEFEREELDPDYQKGVRAMEEHDNLDGTVY